MDRIRDWLEIVGLFGVIASLVFVGLQLKQDRDIALAAAYQARAGIATEGLAAAAANEVTMRTLAKASFGDPGRLIDADGFAAPVTAQEFLTATFTMNSLINLSDNSFHQFQAGFLPEEHWIAVRSTLKDFATVNPLIRQHLAARPNTSNPRFNEMIDDMLAEIDDQARHSEGGPASGADAAH
jgi:hypothetical protein